VQSLTGRMPLLMATSAFRLGRRRWSSRQQCYLHCLRTVLIRNERTLNGQLFKVKRSKVKVTRSRDVSTARSFIRSLCALRVFLSELPTLLSPTLPTSLSVVAGGRPPSVGRVCGVGG